MKFSVCYYDNGRLTTVQSEDWNSLPDSDVLWVDVPTGGGRHRLLGADWYWYEDGHYGVIYDGSCCDPGSTAWAVDGERVNRQPSIETRLLEGRGLPDDEWEAIRRG